MMTPAGLAQLGDGVAAGEEGPLEIDIEAAVPLGLAHRLRRALDPDPGGIDQQIEPAEAGDGGGDHGGAIGDPGDIGRDRQRILPQRLLAQGLGGRRDPLGLNIGKGQRGPGRREPPGEGKTHAARGTRYQDDLVLPIHPRTLHPVENRRQ